VSLEVQIVVGGIGCWLVLLFGRYVLDLSLSDTISVRAAFVAFGFISALWGAAWPLVWVLFGTFLQPGTPLTFSKNLPPGIDEDDLLIVLTIGALIMFWYAASETVRFLMED
jgi:hypothetical protein